MADFFCGSGPSALVERRLGRRFIACDVAWRAVHTTRAKLVGAAKEPFDMLKIEGGKVEGGKVEGYRTLQPATFNVPSPAVPQATCLAWGNPGERQEPSTVTIDLAFIPELDYWEVDPAWDGRVFRSAAQAVRPRRRGTIPAVLSLPERPEGSSLCLRLVSAGGEQYQAVL